MAREFCANHPDAEVSGEFLLSFINGSGSFSNTLKETLSAHGIKDVQRESWYPQQCFLNALRTIQELIGPVLVRQVGIGIGTNLALPDEIHDAENLLNMLGVIYRLFNRNSYGDTIIFEALEKKHGLVILETPYPRSFEEGMVTGLLGRIQQGRTFALVYAPEALPAIPGNKQTCFTVTWS